MEPEILRMLKAGCGSTLFDELGDNVIKKIKR